MDFIEVYFCELSNTTYDNQLLTLVSDKKKATIKNKHIMVSKLSLYSELLVRYLICKKYNIKNNELRFEKNKYGKPYLNNELNIYFNISHTKNSIAAAFSNKEIGVDIEEIRNVDLRIINRFFTKSEQGYINSNINKNEAFFEIWTKKEALVKCIGQGTLMNLNSLCAINNSTYSFVSKWVTKNCIVSICIKNDECFDKCLYEKIFFVKEKEISSFLLSQKKQTC